MADDWDARRADRRRRRPRRLHGPAPRDRHRPRARPGARPAAGRRVQPRGARRRRAGVRRHRRPPRRGVRLRRGPARAAGDRRPRIWLHGWSQAPGPWGTGRYASGRNSSVAGPSSRPTTLPSIASARWWSAGSARRGSRPDGTRWYPTTAATPTHSPVDRPSRLRHRGPPPHLRRPARRSSRSSAARSRRRGRWRCSCWSSPSRAGCAWPPHVDGELAGYLVCSRYDLIWHIMNVSVDPDRRRRGIATAMLDALFERVGRPGRAVHAGGPALQPGGVRALRAARLQGRRDPPPLLRRQRRGRDRDVAHPGDAARLARRRAQRAAAVILALETSCDDTCAAVVTRDGEIRSNVVSSQGIHDRYGGVVPEIASRHHLELVNAVVDDALARAGATLDDVETIAVTQGPGLVGALLIGVATAKGARGGAAAAARARRPPAGPRGRQLPAPGPDRAAVPVPARLRRAHAARPRRPSTGATSGSAARSTTRPARRSTRARGCSASATRAAPRSPSSRPRATRPRSSSPPRAKVAGLDFSFAGLKTALLYATRDLGPEETERRAADLAASYEHAIVEALILRVERALHDEPGAQLAIGGGVAANRQAPRARRAARRPAQGPAARAVHRQRGDDRLRRPLGRAGRVPGLPRRSTRTPPRHDATVTLYGRPGCHLCDDARDHLRAAAADRRARRGRHHLRRRPPRALSRAHPGDRRRRRGAVRLLRGRVEAA